MKKYELYETEDFVLDKEFAHWVLFPDKESTLYWESVVSSFPEKALQIKEARLVIQSIRPVEHQIPEEKLEEIFRTIIRRRNKQRTIYRLTSYAAAAMLLLAIGIVWEISFNPDQKIKIATITNMPQKGRIILSDGSVHEFETEKTIIKQTTSGKTAINNDTIVNKDETSNSNVEFNKVIIPFGKHSEITLADGTHLWLNSGSQLSYPSKFDKKTREIFLTGEAFLEVAPDKSKPFFVNINDFRIKVVGTKFNVSSYNDEATVQTVLVEGKIVAGKNSFFAQTTELSPGERLTYNKDNDKFTKDKVDAALYSSWINGYLIFENEPTPIVFKKLERYYNRRITANENLDKITFSGKLDLREDLSDVLKNIAFASKVKITEKDGNFLIN